MADTTTIQVSREARDHLAQLARERGVTLGKLVEQLASREPTAEQIAERVAAVTVGGMIRDGWGGADLCHALYVATPHLESGGMSIILTAQEDAYPPGFLAVDIDSPGMLGCT
ncbi:hypothetical protein [Streptomyces sp. ISL-12]|uniref:hypothetical protein n=1 Tax=Streptomyces sp. ISL-12 TaxID=2819177 RepID=UPI002035A346|nr:hypothetical protein [Streptomyces sp. ISL-12]